MMSITKHAEKRIQQRAISPETLEVLNLYGLEFFQWGDSVLTTLSKDGREALKRVRKDLDKLLQNKPLAKVENSDGKVVTSFQLYKKHRYKHL